MTAARRIGLASYYRPEGSVLAVESNPKNLRAKARREYAPMTGTSIAAGHVAGTVALMQQAAVEAKGCYLTAQQVREALRQSATPMPGYAEWQVGAGMLDATYAVALARIFPRVVYPEYSQCPSLV